MAKLIITNKKKPEKKLKSFKCYKAKLCTVTIVYSDLLFHDGNEPLPTIGNKIYSITLNSLDPFELFINGTGALPNYEFTASSKNSSHLQNYFITNNDGIVTDIVNCSTYNNSKSRSSTSTKKI